MCRFYSWLTSFWLRIALFRHGSREAFDGWLTCGPAGSPDPPLTWLTWLTWGWPARLIPPLTWLTWLTWGRPARLNPPLTWLTWLTWAGRLA